VSFRSKETETVWAGRFSRALPQDIQQTALQKLRFQNDTRTLADLAVPPNNRLEVFIPSAPTTDPLSVMVGLDPTNSGQWDVDIPTFPLRRFIRPQEVVGGMNRADP
jgi:proteic killer suppression protein